ncbi:MAG: EMC3/TMCO1 family protein [Thermoproteota archaeon]
MRCSKLSQLLPPVSTGLLALVVLGVTLFQMLVSRKLMDPSLRSEIDTEVKAYRAELKEAQRLKDKQALKRLEKREVRIRQLEGKLAGATAKQMVLTIGVLLLVFYGLVPQIGRYGAYITSPLLENFISFKEDGRYIIPAVWWYFICATFFQSVLGRIFGRK